MSFVIYFMLTLPAERKYFDFYKITETVLILQSCKFCDVVSCCFISTSGIMHYFVNKTPTFFLNKDNLRNASFVSPSVCRR